MKFYFEPKLSGENKKIIAVTAKLANEVSRALSKSAVARDTRKTGNAMLNFTDEPESGETVDCLLVEAFLQTERRRVQRLPKE
jgi:hypothetical protein